jgi:hypothetical protein
MDNINKSNNTPRIPNKHTNNNYNDSKSSKTSFADDKHSNSIDKRKTVLADTSISATRDANSESFNKITDEFYNDLKQYLTLSKLNASMLTENFLPRIHATRDDNGFFNLSSKRLEALFIQAETKNLAVIQIIDAVKNKINTDLLASENVNLSFCLDFLDSVKVYYQMVKQLTNLLGFSAEDKKKYTANIYKLFIEGNILYKNIEDYNNDSNDSGMFLFDNEWRYSSRSIIALAMAIETLVVHRKTLSIDIIKNIASVFSCKPTDNNTKVEYGVYFLPEHPGALDELLQKGKIAKRVTYDSIYNIPDECNRKTFNRLKNLEMEVPLDKDLLEEAINTKLKKNHKIRLQDTEKDYCRITSIIEKDTGKETEVNSEAYPFKFILNTIDKQKLGIVVKFDTDNHDKQAYTEQIIADFNTKIQEVITDLEYLTALTKLGSLLCKTHFLEDANGRSIFFILYPTLIISRGLWPTKQLYNLWEDIAFLPYEQLAQLFLNNCIKMPTIKPNLTADWRTVLPEDEKVRIACTTNDTKLVQALYASSDTIQHPVSTNSPETKKLPLELMQEYANHNLYKDTISFLEQITNT